jgi:bifunctional non-homologous end joining protein LigD
MLATPGPIPTGDGWAFELKWDGVRTIVDVGRGRVRVFGRSANDVTASYPELHPLPDLLAGRKAILDGEVVALDDVGVPSFQRIHVRMHVRQPSDELVAAVPVMLYVFDLLSVDGRSLLAVPYRQRRERLAELGLNGPLVATPPHVVADGHDLFQAAVDVGQEGVVAKRLASGYEAGRRSRAWVKTPIDSTTEVVIGGWVPGAGRRAGTLGSLVLGAYDERGALLCVGGVGTGFTEEALAQLHAQLRRIERSTSPFDLPVPHEYAVAARWVEPTLVGEVVYRTVSPDGRLRHPSWRGLRPDREPSEVRNPQAM